MRRACSRRPERTRRTAILMVVFVAAGVSGLTAGVRSPQTPSPWSVPFFDLARDRFRQVVVDREPGQYLGHPTTVLLENNRTIIAVYPKGHGKGPIVMKRSEDGGLTWTVRLPVPDNWATSLEVPTIFRTIDPGDGHRRLILFSGFYPARLASSEDDGLTWTRLRPAGNWGGIVVMASMVRLENGDYMAFFHDDGRFFRKGGKADQRFRLYQVRSKDGGLTWGTPDQIFESSELHLCEPGVIRSPDGKRLAMLLRENRRVKQAHLMLSDDEATSWSAPRELPAILTGDRHVGKYGPDGRLFISSRDTSAASPTKGDWVGWVGTFEDLVNGREGQYRVRLMDNKDEWDCGYPAIEVLPGGVFVVTTYGHWDEGQPPYIVSVRLTLADLDRRVRK